MSDMILKAINMPKKEQIERNRSMQERLSRYTVNYYKRFYEKFNLGQNLTRTQSLIILIYQKKIN